MTVGRPQSEEPMTEISVRVTETAKQALVDMAISPKRQGRLLTDLLLAAKDEYSFTANTKPFAWTGDGATSPPKHSALQSSFPVAGS